jgi:hypothetical protein
MKNENYEDRAQEQLASLKRDMRKTMEDATVRATHKVMAEFEAKSDERLMGMRAQYSDIVSDGGLDPRNKFDQPAQPVEQPEYKFCDDGKVIFKNPEILSQRAQEQHQESVAIGWYIEGYGAVLGAVRPNLRYEEWRPFYAIKTTPQRKPLTHEQRVDLLAKFEAHKHEWHAPAILIDMVEAAHNIKETP